MANNQVTLQFPRTADEDRRLYLAGEFAIEVKRWLESQGLKMGEDFNWEVKPDVKSITFTFEKDPSWTSFLSLKYLGK